MIISIILYFFHLISLFIINSINEITFDEAYYWCYAQELSLCYISKPPLLMWFIHYFSKKLSNLNNFKKIRILSLFLDIVFIIFFFIYFPNKISNLLFLITTNIFMFKKYVLNTDGLLIIFNLIILGSYIHYLGTGLYIYWILLLLGNIGCIYTKQIGLITPILLLIDSGFNINILFLSIICYICFIPILLSNNFKHLIYHTFNSNIINNSILNNYSYKNIAYNFFFNLISQISCLGIFHCWIILKYYKSVSINILSIYPLIVFTILSLVKRINANWLSIYLINTIILLDFDQFNVYLLFYDVLIFYIISLLFLKLNLKVKRKYRNKKTFKNLKSILKNYNNYNIVFNSSRKLGSYIWFYTLIKPINNPT